MSIKTEPNVKKTFEEMLNKMMEEDGLTYYTMYGGDFPTYVLSVRKDGYSGMDYFDSNKVERFGFFVSGIYIYPNSSEISIYLQRRG